MKALRLANFLVVVFVVHGCNLDVPVDELDVIEYDNFMIYSDLSSRMGNNPSDTLIINQIIDFFVSDCVKPGIKVNDRSAISFSRVNYRRSNCPSSKIDIGLISNLEEKQQFVNNKNDLKNLGKAILDFKGSVSCNYSESDYGGLDLISLIHQELNTGNHIKEPGYLIGETDTTTLYYHNHLFVFTDGYLEYSTSDGAKGLYYGEEKIEELREFCLAFKVSPEDAIRENDRFQLRPLVSESNRLVNLYILETDDRGFNVKRGTLKNAGELSDNNLLRLVWKVWAEESGFAHFEWRAITRATNLPADFIQKLLHRQVITDP